MLAPSQIIFHFPQFWNSASQKARFGMTSTLFSSESRQNSLRVHKDLLHLLVLNEDKGKHWFPVGSPEQDSDLYSSPSPEMVRLHKRRKTPKTLLGCRFFPVDAIVLHGWKSQCGLRSPLLWSLAPSPPALSVARPTPVSEFSSQHTSEIRMGSSCL